jgi:hypothetical protein
LNGKRQSETSRLRLFQHQINRDQIRNRALLKR